MENQQAQPHSSQSDAEKNKAMAIIGYIFSFLFFIPLVSEDSKKSVFAKFHANQQLILLIYWVGAGIVISVFSFVLTLILASTFFFLTFLAPLVAILLWLAYSVFGIVLMVLGIVNASKGEMAKLPLVGGISFIK